MCGIAGIYKFIGGSSDGVDRDALIRIRDHMRLRGPDDAGVWFSPDNRIGLAHRRLAIIAPGPAGHQPMQSTFGDQVISFNGEIYNYRALQEVVRDHGYHLKTDSDTEVLLALYHLFGADMLCRLRGMYSFGIWDQQRQGLFLARDPYGIKPLFYSATAAEFRFASQVKALVNGGSISKELSIRAEASFLLTGSIMEPDALYDDIQMLEAGHSLWVDQRGVGQPSQHQNITQLFDHPVHQQVDSADSNLVVREALFDSVKHHLVADVAVGTFLSAGIDSGAITTLATDVLDNPVHTVTIGFEEYLGTNDDETALAAQVAIGLSTEHCRRVVTQVEFEQDIDHILNAMDQPSIDGLNTWFVSKAAAERGLTVMLSGLGGDELFGGYPSFKDIPHWNSRFAFLKKFPLVDKISRSMANSLRFLPVSPKIFGMAGYAHSLEGAYLLRRGLYMPWELDQIMGQERAAAALESLNIPAILDVGLKGNSVYQQIAAMESKFYLRNQLLRDTDWASMAHSLEIRTPLVDSVLSAKLAPVVATMPGKHWLGQSLPQALPAQVMSRPKTGFTTPVGSWLMQSKSLDQWRRFPWLGYGHVHWSRRYASCLHQIIFANG